jgi:hypothetical protein
MFWGWGALIGLWVHILYMERITTDLQKINDGKKFGVTYNNDEDLTEFDGDNGYIATIKAQSFEKVTLEDLKDFVEEYRPITKEFENDMSFKFGLYKLESGKIDIDFNVYTQDKDRAKRIGKNCNQESVWDVEKAECIKTGGRGEQIENIEEVLEELA